MTQRKIAPLRLLLCVSFKDIHPTEIALASSFAFFVIPFTDDAI